MKNHFLHINFRFQEWQISFLSSCHPTHTSSAFKPLGDEALSGMVSLIFTRVQNWRELEGFRAGIEAPTSQCEGWKHQKDGDVDKKPGPPTSDILFKYLCAFLWASKLSLFTSHTKGSLCYCFESK